MGVMIDLVKKTMLAGIGLAVVTKDKVLESLDELVEKGKLTKEEAVAMSEKIVDENITKMHPCTIDIKVLIRIWRTHAKMICNTLVHIEFCCPSKYSS